MDLASAGPPQYSLSYVMGDEPYFDHRGWLGRTRTRVRPPRPRRRARPGRAGTGHLNPTVIAEFRANAGQVDGQFGGPLLLLTSIGAKSGKPRVNPLNIPHRR